MGRHRDANGLTGGGSSGAASGRALLMPRDGESEVAEAVGVGKGSLFRRFEERKGLLLALLGEAEADFPEAYTSGPPPLGPGVPAKDRQTVFGAAP